MGSYSNLPRTSNGRDSLELGSLASSTHSSPGSDGTSSPSGPPSSRKLSFDDDDPLHTSQPNGSRPGRIGGRSYSISSAFDFAPTFQPLTSSHAYTSLGDPSATPIDTEGGSLEKNKTLTYLNGLSLVIGLVIGSGIFSSPSEVTSGAGSPGASLILWTIAGVLAWTGAASYAELGGAIPLNGGAQVYLAKTYGEPIGFMFSWCMVCAGKPGSAAIMSIIFGEYVVRAIIGADALDASTFTNKACAVAGLFLVTLLNCISTKLASRSADLFMFLKFVALIAITTIGIVVAVTGFSWNGEPSTDWKTRGWFDGTSTDLSSLAVALYGGLFAFDGWDNVNFVAGEFVNPTRDLPRVVHTSMPLVIVFYLLANVAYFLVLPFDVCASSSTIAVAFGNQVLGRLGSLFLALAVCGSTFGALNATTFSTGRLFFAAGKEGYLPAFFGKLGFGKRRPVNLSASASGRERSKIARIFSKICGEDTLRGLFATPIAALFLQFTVALAYIIIGNFSILITFGGVLSYTFYFLTVLAVLVLRVKEPSLERPYRCWITTPIIFCCVSLFLLSRSFVARPWESLSAVGFMVVGLIVYGWKYLISRGQAKNRTRQRDGVESSGWRFWKRWS